MVDPETRLRALGRALSEARTRAEVMQVDAATAVGKSQSQISDLERGVRDPGVLLFLDLCELYGIGAGVLITRARELIPVVESDMVRN